MPRVWGVELLRGRGRAGQGRPGSFRRSLARRCVGASGAARHFSRSHRARDDRHWRVRPRARRRHGARLRRSHRRRAGHRQVDPPAASHGATHGRRGQDALRLRRGVHAADAPPCGPVGDRGVRALHASGDARRGDPTPRHGNEAARARRRLDTDRDCRGSGDRPGQPHTDTRERCGAHPLREVHERACLHRGSRHEGRVHRRTQDAGAHGGHGRILRGRPAPRLPHRAGREEPVWVHARDGCVRDVGSGTHASGKPIRPIPQRTTRRNVRLRRRVHDGGLAAPAARATGRRALERPCASPRAWTATACRS